MTRHACLLTLTLAAIVLAACGSQTGPVAATNTNAAQLLGAYDLNRVPIGSPARALLTWWRDVQYADLTGYLNGLDRSLRLLRVAVGAGENELTILSSQLRTARPIVLDTEGGGTTATVYALISVRAPLGARAYTTTETPQAFAMVFEDGGWRIADATFVLQRVGPVLDQQARAASASSPGTIGLPSLKGLDVSIARLELFDLGMIGRTQAATTTRQPSGTVVGQQPAAGTTLRRGTAVTLQVASAGP